MFYFSFSETGGKWNFVPKKSNMGIDQKRIKNEIDVDVSFSTCFIFQSEELVKNGILCPNIVLDIFCHEIFLQENRYKNKI